MGRRSDVESPPPGQMKGARVCEESLDYLKSRAAISNDLSTCPASTGFPLSSVPLLAVL